ncbi:hypothetical protein JCM10212_000821 [Sporobolomyces blumeae]
MNRARSNCTHLVRHLLTYHDATLDLLFETKNPDKRSRASGRCPTAGLAVDHYLSEILKMRLENNWNEVTFARDAQNYIEKINFICTKVLNRPTQEQNEVLAQLGKPAYEAFLERVTRIKCYEWDPISWKILHELLLGLTYED